MFRKTLVILFFYIFLSFCKPIYSFEFVKSTDNPLPISYIDGYSDHQQANVFKEGNIYKAILTIHKQPDPFHTLGYFESIDGINWEMKKVVLNTSKDLSNPGILKTIDGYLLFLTEYDGSIYKISSSACDNNFNCSANLSPVIIPDTNDNSEKNGVFAGRSFRQDNRTYLFFGAWGRYDGFKIKLAYSDDLFTWTRCPNSFLSGGDGPFPYQENNDLYLFFHQSNSEGIKLAKTTLPLSCSSNFEDQGSLLTKGITYDQNHMIFPSVINENGGLKLYYSGRDNNSVWRISLACTGQACLIPTPTPTLQPTSYPLQPIIVIPGFMASWNKKAIIHNKTINYSEWKLQNFVKEYDGLISTLKNVGYEEDVNLFLFAYDWRQSIDKTTDDLNNFLQDKIWNDKPNQKINIVGHSFGGLVGRIFTQKNTDKINKIITVSSPHNGVVQVYKPLEAGEIDRVNTFLWLAEKMILVLNKSTIESDRVTFTNKFPATKDLIPTFNFLKDLSGKEISNNNLTLKNIFLPSYNQNFSGIFPIFTAIYGEKNNNTLAGYIVEPQNILDKLLGNYVDGKPKESYGDLGDDLILSKSSNQDSDSQKFNYDHGEVIYKKEPIKEILNLLNINFNDDQIIEGKKTVISPSIIFLIKSPATMTVKSGEDNYPEEEGIIFIPNAQSGNYNLKVQGTDQGKYEVVVGQIAENNDIWESINGEITNSSASSQIDDYSIMYNSQTATSIITPTVTPTITLVPTSTPTMTPTAIPTATLVPTSTPQQATTVSNSTSSKIASSSNEIPMSKESLPAVLGISSIKEEIITPTILSTKQSGIKKEIIKSSNTRDYVWALISSLIIGVIGYLFRKKIFN